MHPSKEDCSKKILISCRATSSLMGKFLEIKDTFLLLPALFLPVLFIIIKNLKSYFVSRNSAKLPPGPNPWPILGNIPHIGLMPHVSLANLAKIYGPLMSLKLGTQCIIVGSSPEAAIEILKSKDRIFSGRYIPKALPATKEELNHLSLGWADCNDNWKSLRILCRAELFSKKALESQARLREKSITSLIKFVGSKEGKEVKIADLVFATVFNILGNSMMSTDFIGLEEKNSDGGMKGIIRDYVEALAAPNLSDFYPILGKLDLQGIRRKVAVLLAKIRAAWGPIIEERRNGRNNSSTSQDFLDTLLDNGFSYNQINQLFVELFAAGTDTTTSTVEWTMVELLKNPEAMKNVHREIDTEINEDFPNNSHLLQLPYLEACTKETLRLHPPAPLLLPHRAIETGQVMNYTVPKNAQLVVNAWAIGRNPSVWDKPLEFRPERFLTSSLDFKGNDFEFLPFSAGRRICPGLPMAAKTIPLIVASLIYFFNWSLPHGINPKELNMSEKFGVTMQMEHPLVLVPEARK
ncbi:probable (S)-N-methylcoclaurine 3 -hydroxylase isozyme 2 [Olea europaea subsp. europaea]|uniref:Probable (S)-N-methylcoclaurine 3 -hydroxylase isozyme 2 n=1 Tax=Olea europaea subsp. europaea TaxID=158383 RepID=A0A8S0SL54_OLEEU|nr:probable (S)-N-methylcoclaurine 3 -hydroxylase isozyme 2 [Olea europaea subsp. europaea]